MAFGYEYWIVYLPEFNPDSFLLFVHNPAGSTKLRDYSTGKERILEQPSVEFVREATEWCRTRFEEEQYTVTGPDGERHWHSLIAEYNSRYLEAAPKNGNTRLVSHQRDRIVTEKQQSSIGFIEAQRLAQAEYFRAACPEPGYNGSAYRLAPHLRDFNLAPSIREVAEAYFREKEITWHIHANHGLSSQVCCLNFLMPLATRPDMLSRVVANALGIEPPKMLESERGPNGEPWFIGFEWIGKSDYLNEGSASLSRTRGANATSSDAVLRFRHSNRIETLLIEWKYTEAYGSPIPNKVREGAERTSNEVRADRYRDLIFAPNGPIRNDLNLELEDFFWEPFYQLLRQQMLAFQMEKAHEDGTDRVRVLHISPAENRRLRVVTSKALSRFGADAFAVFAETLVDPAAFVSRTIEQVFGPILAEMPGDPWAAYLAGRYTFLAATDDADALPRPHQS